MKLNSTPRNNTTLAFVVAALLLLAPVAAYAGFDSILAKGFKPNVAYQMNEFDTVNTFNGELMADVPLGPTYKTNGTLQYSFGLHYTSDFWNYIEYWGVNVPSPEPQSITYITDIGWNAFGVTIIDWSGGPSGSPDNHLGSEAIPWGLAGVGWNPSIERFTAEGGFATYRSGTYTDASGAGHVFTPEIHKTPYCVPGPCNNTVAYTHDGSYLRMRLVDNNDLVREIDLPDGTVKRFRCVADCDRHYAQWNLEFTADPFGNVLLIERYDGVGQRSEQRPEPGLWIWNFIEGRLPNGETRAEPYYRGDVDRNSLQIVRQHSLVFTVEDPEGKFRNQAGLVGVRLLRAELAGPGGDQSMVYTLNYEEKNILRTVVRPWVFDDSDLLFHYDGQKRINVKVLSSITVPAQGGRWQFDYYPGDASDGPANGISYTWCMDYNAPSTNCPFQWQFPTSRLAGRIKRILAPTGGGYEYEYTSRAVPKRVCGAGPRNGGGYGGGLMMAVKKRKQIGADGQEIAGAVWHYAGHGYFRRFVDENPVDGADDGSGACRAPREFLASTLDPNGLLTINYYNVKVGDMNSDDLGTGGKWYGAPYTPVSTDTVRRRDGSSELRYLSSQQYDANFVDVAPFRADLDKAVRGMFQTYRGDDPATSARLLRSRYVHPEMSAAECDFENNDCEHYNLRMASEHTRFDDDSATTSFTTSTGPVTERAFVERVYSDFDGVGNYRQTNTYGNLKAVANGNATAADWDHRVDYTYFNPNIEWNGIDGLPPNLPVRWFLATHSHTTVLEKNRVGSKRYLFDTQRGFLRAMQTIKDSYSAEQPSFTQLRSVVAESSGDDLLAVYTRADGTGADSVVTEKSYGGDGANLPAPISPTGQLTTPAQASYELESLFRYGTLARTSYLACGGVGAETYVADVEQHTGLPTTMTDATGLITLYDYDDLGRVTTVTPPGGQIAQSYTYETRTEPGEDANRLTISRGENGPLGIFEYDHLGRISAEKQAVPSGTSSVNAVTDYEYTHTGLLFKETLPLGQGTARGVIEHTYDILSRETKIKNADNKIVETAFIGGREYTTTTRGVATDSGGTNAQMTKKFDSFGRLSEVSDSILHGDYDYDALSNLTKASLKPVGGGTVQERRFEYDGRGLIGSAAHPELKSAVHGQLLVKTTFDARGHITGSEYAWEVGGGNKPNLDRWRLKFDMDKTERLRVVRRPAGANNLPALELKKFEYYPDSDPDGRRNQMRSALRHNYIPDFNVAGGTATVDFQTEYTYTCPSTAECTGLLQKATTTASTTGANGQRQTIVSGSVSYHYNTLGELTRIDYPEVGAPQTPTRFIHNVYNVGFLTTVKDGPQVGTATRRAALEYHVNGLVSKVDYSVTGVNDVISRDGSGVPRPSNVRWNWSGGGMDSGGYVYDGAGNIEWIGSDRFLYDKALRIKSAKMSNRLETYNYDAFGNVLKAGDRQFTVDPSSNRLTGRTIAGSSKTVAYDEAGNITQIPDARASSGSGAKLNFAFDPLNMMTEMTGAGLARAFVYDASDERVAVLEHEGPNGRRELWSFRDQGKRVIRDFVRTGPSWTWKKDYIYRGAMLSNTATRDTSGVEQVYDVHVDHLGSPRYVSNSQGNLVLPVAAPGEPNDGSTRYFPFGTLVFAQIPVERLGFTGHERDEDGSPFGEADVDFMHARYYNPALARFQAPDTEAGNPDLPQSWNRYSYALNDPLRMYDPDGRSFRDVISGIGDGLRNTAIHTVQGVKAMFTNPVAAIHGTVHALGFGVQSYFTEAGRRRLAANYQAADTRERAAAITEGVATATIIVEGPKVVAKTTSAATQAVAFGSRTGRAVWSGEGAMQQAMASGARTIGETPAGRAIQGVENTFGPNVARPLWDAASKAWAQGAKGEVPAFLNSPRPSSIFMQTELPALVNNMSVTRIPVFEYGRCAANIPLGR